MMTVAHAQIKEHVMSVEETGKVYKIINGVDKVLTLDKNVKDGDIVIVRHFPPFRSTPKDIPMRYTNPQFNQRFQIIGEFAYYLGEEICIPPNVEETEELVKGIK